VKIFTKRNALVGYLTLKAQSRARRHYLRRQKKRSGLKLVTLVVIGILSVGLLIAFAGVLHRRQNGSESIEGIDVTDEIESVTDDLADAADQIPAT